MAFDNGTKSLPKNYFLYLNHFKSLNLDLKTSSRIGSGKKFCQGRVGRAINAQKIFRRRQCYLKVFLVRLESGGKGGEMLTRELLQNTIVLDRLEPGVRTCFESQSFST